MRERLILFDESGSKNSRKIIKLPIYIVVKIYGNINNQCFKIRPLESVVMETRLNY